MKRPFIYSALLHFTVLIFILVGFYNPFQRKRPSETPMMIEFVHVAEQSAAPQLAPEVIKDEPKPLPPKPTPPKPEPIPEPPAPQPEPEPAKPEPQPMPEPKPEEAEALPDPNLKKKPKDKPKEEKKEKPKKQKAEITLDKTKKPKTKPDDTKPEKKKKPSQNFDELLDKIENEDGEPSKGKGAPASTIGPVLTASEKDALSRHMSRCWLVPPGLRDARNIRVPIKINVARDGTVQKAEIQDKSKMSDPAYRAAAESAKRAVLDPQCSPLPIPSDKYEMFKEFIFNFDPKEMF